MQRGNIMSGHMNYKVGDIVCPMHSARSYDSSNCHHIELQITEISGIGTYEYHLTCAGCGLSGRARNNSISHAGVCNICGAVEKIQKRGDLKKIRRGKEYYCSECKKAIL